MAEYEHLTELAFALLASQGWKDDPNDKNRTMANLQMTAIRYCEQRLGDMERWPIYVEDENDPKCQVGIEQNFDVVLSFEDGKKVRYIGTIDGLVKNERTGNERWFLDENKTANRLSEAWRQSFDMSHQITGYCAASTATFGFPVMRNRVTGSKLPPSNSVEDVSVIEPVERDATYIHRWAQWIRSMSETFDKYRDNWEYADRYTHSCMRYFRTCALLPFCCDSPEGRQESFYKQMVPADETPSERAIVSHT